MNGSVLAWARENSGMSPSELASGLHVDLETLRKWESGEAFPSKGEFTKISRTLRRPSAIFFLPSPPVMNSVPSSFRSAPGLYGHEPTKSEMQQFRWAQRLQDLMSWIAKDQHQNKVDLPQFRIGSSTERCAASIREYLDVPVAQQLRWRNPYAALREWRLALELKSILVFQMELGRDGIRGFSTWDGFAPVVGINGAYHPTARIYTLMHEVGHLVTRTDSACYKFVSPIGIDPAVERWCEKFAAECLIPRDELLTELERFHLDSSPVRDVEVAKTLAGRFKVSTRAMGLRLQELDLASDGYYDDVAEAMGQFDWNPRVENNRSGQPAPVKRVRQLGTLLPETLIDAAAGGRITSADLSDYLHLTTNQVGELRGIIGSRG